MSVSWDDLPEVSKQVVIDELDAMKARELTPEAGWARREHVRAIIDAALEKLGWLP